MSKGASNENSNENSLTLAFSLHSQSERRRQVVLSYQFASGNQKKSRLANLPWATWSIALITCVLWGITAYQVAFQAGAHTLQEILGTVGALDEDPNVLIAFGAKYTPAIIKGQYWRLITPIFLHANLLHLGLNMLNFLLLGLMIEHIFGHVRFILIYLLTGIFSILASLVFAPLEISVGASGAIFGLVGAYSAFILIHREAFRYHGILALGWLILVIGINIGLGFVIPGIDNYAHVGGLLSGCLLGWFFAPFYSTSPAGIAHNGLPMPADVHSLKRRWPLALLSIVIIVVSAIIATQLVGG